MSVPAENFSEQNSPENRVPAAAGDACAGTSREIAVPGVRNFRDLGGIAVAGGKRVRRGLVFRSAKFDTILPEGERVIAALGVRTIVDFRSPGERARNPTRAALGAPARTILLPVFADTPNGYFEEKLTCGLTPEAATAFMEEANRSFAREHAAAFRDFFALFDDEANFPLIFHCTGGKDRTGFAAAMLLSVLGAGDDAIFDDFLLSRKNTIPKSNRATDALLEIVPAETLDVLLTVLPQFLRASLDEIDAVWGSRERFLREALGVVPARAAHMRAFLLE